MSSQPAVASAYQLPDGEEVIIRPIREAVGPDIRLMACSNQFRAGDRLDAMPYHLSGGAKQRGGDPEE